MSAAEYLRDLADGLPVWCLKEKDALRACADLVEAVQAIDDISLCENHARCRNPVCHALSVVEAMGRK